VTTVESPLRFREYQPDDRAGVLAVFDSNVPEFFTTPERGAFEEFLRDLPGPYFVVEYHDSIVACGGYAIVLDESRADFCWGMVGRALHGRGIGRFLTELRINAARSDPKVSMIILNTSQHTEAFYERLGFVTEKCTKDGFAPGLDRCDMRLVLR
jgi:ribosomal protein S18 acetylase RimI-like enzyme